MKFNLGRVVATPGALQSLEGRDGPMMLARHVQGDWGDVDDHDRAVNESSLKHGGRLVSVYYSSSGERLWVITEADRSATTILKPEEY